MFVETAGEQRDVVSGTAYIHPRDYAGNAGSLRNQFTPPLPLGTAGIPFVVV